MSDRLRRIASSLRWRFAKLLALPLRRRLRDQVREVDERGICIVSNNCVSGILYELARLPKRSPTAGLYFSGNAYALFLDDLNKGRLTQWAKIDPADLVIKEEQSCWALPVQGGGELVFLHYTSPEEAVSKWKRRLDRMSGRTPLVISSIQEGITLKSVEEALKGMRYFMTVDGDPAPAADELLLDRRFLRDLSAYLHWIVHASGHDDRPHSMYRYSSR